MSDPDLDDAPGARAEPRWARHQQRVIYGDTDAMGVVYYGTYLRFLEVGRAELLRAAGRAYSEVEAAGVLIPVIEVGLKYHAPARYDDLLEVATRVDELGRATVGFAYRITRLPAGELIASGFTRHASIDAASRRVCRIPADLLALLREQVA